MGDEAVGGWRDLDDVDALQMRAENTLADCGDATKSGATGNANYKYAYRRRGWLPSILCPGERAVSEMLRQRHTRSSAYDDRCFVPVKRARLRGQPFLQHPPAVSGELGWAGGGAQHVRDIP